MSEVAVKIYELKRDIQRIHLAHPVFGKDGATQKCVFLNSETNQPVQSIRFPKRGFYAYMDCMATAYGENDGFQGAFLIDWSNFEKLCCAKQKLGFTHRGAVRTAVGIYYAWEDGISVPVPGFHELPGDIEILSYYATFRYLDDH